MAAIDGILYVIYIWKTLSLGNITCAKPCVGWKEVAKFMHKLNNSSDDYIVLDIARRISKEDMCEQKATTEC